MLRLVHPGRLPRSAALSLAAAIAAFTACRGQPPPAPAPEARRYTARGEVVRLPAPGRPEVLVRHEAIPDFVDQTGAAVGMAAMTMPFPVDPGVRLDGFAPGDKIRFRFRMDWKANAFAIESVEALPRDTPLDLGGGSAPRP